MTRLQTMMTAGRALGTIQQSGVLRHPVLKMAAKYWWASLPVGLALYGKIRERMETEGKVKIHQYLSDAADVLGPVLTLVGIIELAERLDSQGKLAQPVAAAPAVPAAPPGAMGEIISPPFVEDTPHPSRQRASR